MGNGASGADASDIGASVLRRLPYFNSDIGLDGQGSGTALYAVPRDV